MPGTRARARRAARSRYLFFSSRKPTFMPTW
jgi:hypothetical protein